MNRDILNLVLLVIVSLAIILGGRFGLLTPQGAAQAREQLAVWWSVHQAAVLWSAGGLTALALGGLIARSARRRQAQRELLDAVADGPTFQLLPRADWKKIEPEDVQVWVRLADALPHDEHISFEVAGNENGIFFLLHGSKNGAQAAMTQFRAEWTGLFRKPVQAEEDAAILPPGWSAWWVELTPASYEQAVRAATDDALRAALIELNGVLGDGRGLIQVVARRNFGARKQLGQKAFAARDEETESKGVRALRAQEAKELEARARATYLDVTLRAAGMADTPERAQGIARALARAISASFEGGNPVQAARQGGDPRPLARREPGKAAVWSANDLAYLAHMPGGDLVQVAPRLQTAPARYLPADPEMRFDPAVYRTAFLEG
jgi:hypothetical protein